MSDALTDTTENRTAAAAAPGGAEKSGRHRGAHSPSDETVPVEATGHGRHRRTDQPPVGPVPAFG